MALPSFPPFSIAEGETSTATRWKKWLAKLENLMLAMDISNPDRKKALLLHYGGEEIFDVVETFTDEQKQDYTSLITSLQQYFIPKTNVTYESFKFRKMSQDRHETINQFFIRLKTQAQLCDFHSIDREILAQLIEGTCSPQLRRKALRENLNLEKFLAEARNEELTSKQANDIESSLNQAHAVLYTNNGHYNKRTNGHHHAHKPDHTKRGHHYAQNKSNHNAIGKPKQNTVCRNCGGNYPHAKQCPAKDQTCHSCGKKNHFSSVCRSKPQKTYVKQVAQEREDSEEIFTVDKGKSKIPTITAELQGFETEFIVDTGASVNIISSTTFNKMDKKPKLQHSTLQLYAYNATDRLDVLGTFTSKIKYKRKSTSDKFYVVKMRHPVKSNNLLSAETAQRLEIISFALNISVPNDIYNGFGKIKDLKIKLHIDESVQPIAQAYRRTPFHIRKDVEKALSELEEMDIIEPVEGPTPWVSPIVAVPKKSGGVRICVDMREANKAVKRERHPMPTIDDLINQLNGSRWFSRLDLKQAFHQLELEEDSRFITTFATHIGLRRYKRLMFGVNSAPEIFQHVLSGILRDIPGATNFIDDIIVFGKTKDAHDESLKNTLELLHAKGAKLNRDKCLFGKNELSFLGHVFGGKGISPEPKKIEAIKNTGPPTSVGELRSFLGMTQFVSRYIKNYTNITEPLRRMTKKNQEWKWSEEQNTAFNKLKNILTKDDVMTYFDQDKKTDIIVDASPHGLGAILSQEGQIVRYASRALTDVEQRYSQTDREMLAVVYGVEHFHMYLYGADFTVTTDHKPLLGLISSKRQCTPRMDRWRLRLMPYEFTLKYSPGRNELNPADYLSRHPVTQPLRDNDGENFIRYVANSSAPIAIPLDRVRDETQRDEELRNVMIAIQSGNWHKDSSITAYQRVKEELSVYDGVVLRSNRLVLPESLRKQAVSLAHASHQGVVKTKQLLREKLWFPGIDKMVQDELMKCIPCQASFSGAKQREPIRMTPLPKRPMDEVSIDFAGPFPTGEYLLLFVDDFSRFPEIEVLHSTKAKVVTQRLDQIFARYGIPRVVKSDNGPPFNGFEFANFARQLGFKHRKITPLWPEANGGVERFVRSVEKFIRTCETQDLHWKHQLPQFLRQYRATPHCTTNISPHEALTGRKMRTSLPEMVDNNPSLLASKVADSDSASKAYQKEYADKKRHTTSHTLKTGDTVLVRQPRQNKLSTPFDPKPFIVTKTNGSMITAKRGHQHIVRNSSYFKPIPLSATTAEEEGGENTTSTNREVDSDDTEPHESSAQSDQLSTTKSQVEQSLSSPSVVEFPYSSQPYSQIPLPHVAEQNCSLQSPRAHHQTKPIKLTTRSGRVVNPPNRYTL